MELIIGDKSWSTWSMRAWLTLKRTGEPFTETLVRLRRDDLTTADMRAAGSPSGQAPVLKDGEAVVWDSLAICQYLNDRFPKVALWPADLIARAYARSVTAEMHAGFASMRGECPMDLEHIVKADLTPATEKDVRRIVELWRQGLRRFGGPWVAGEWSIADAFYTPVATRVRTYSIHLGDYGDTGEAAEYCSRLLSQPHFLEWEAAALKDLAEGRTKVRD
jgi:glutathione S-transferase